MIAAGPADSQSGRREFTVPVADRPDLAIGLHASIDRATGAVLAELRGQGAAASYARADYATDFGPVDRALRPIGGGTAGFALPIDLEQLEAFVAEGEPWRLTLAAGSGTPTTLVIPVPGIAEFLDEIDRYRASHPAGGNSVNPGAGPPGIR